MKIILINEFPQGSDKWQDGWNMQLLGMATLKSSQLIWADQRAVCARNFICTRQDGWPHHGPLEHFHRLEAP